MEEKNIDIKYIRENFQFIYRVAAVIFNKEQDKILLFSVENRDFYLLPGGKVNELEMSIDAIKREIKEELGYELYNYEFFAFNEQFVKQDILNNHQINIIYKAIYNDDIKEIKFKGLEGDWINFEWININDIDKYNIYPRELKNIIKNPNKQYHFVDNLIKE